MKTSLVLSTIVGAGLVAAADCPAPGFSDSQGRYSCNPAHQYPEGQQCKEIDGCLFLTDASGKPVINKTTSSEAAQPTSACPAPGFTDSQGRYSCNPAHQYPEGQQCKETDGCLFLTDANGKPVINKTTSSGAAQPTSACPAPGFTDSQGRYSCNPAHQYPAGQQCKEIDGCLFLCDANGKPVISNPTSVVTSGAAQPTNACPAPGFTDSKGRYSCNPAHQYPAGQQCKEIDGCLFLCDANGQPVINQPSSTGSGSGSGTGPNGPVITAGAATLSGAGLLGLVGLAVALF
ncbi:hypothetical protein E4U45_005972 [Claviceps purpurea]|nr:hypothetical protein E4U45_005972 [Claviceps purpurea]